MTAAACLRILLDESLAPDAVARLSPLVTRVVMSYLESRWTWPREYMAIDNLSFVITDRRSSAIARAEVNQIATDLHSKLFGTKGEGRVEMMMFEGGEEDVHVFARMDAQSVRVFAEHPERFAHIVGRLSPISPSDDDEALKPSEANGQEAPMRYEAIYSGVWFLPRQTFVGCSIAARRVGALTPFRLLEDIVRQSSLDAALEFDRACLAASAAALAAGPAGILFIPINFTAAVRHERYEFYTTLMAGLAGDQRNRLAATVYNVPRDPGEHDLDRIRLLLGEKFSAIDLYVQDVGFEVARLPPGVTSVTLVPPDAETKYRIAGIRDFMAMREAFKLKRIWPAVSNVRSAREREFCISLRVPFLSGSAICHPLGNPIEPQPYPAVRLPMRQAS